MSDSADAIGFSDPDLAARLNFPTPSNCSMQGPEPVLEPTLQNGEGSKRLDFPAANLGRLRAPVAEPESRPSDKSKSRKSVALERKRRREAQRQRIRDDKAKRLARQLAIEEDLDWEGSQRKKLLILMWAWIVGLSVNALILVYLWCSVGAWAPDKQPISLVFSAIEMEAEDSLEVDFSLPSDVMPEEVEVELDQALVEVMTVDALEAAVWSEDPEPIPDPLAEGLFDAVDPGVSGLRGDSDGGGSQGKGASFFGIEGSGDRLVYVVDCSGSMGFERRFQRAVYELSQSLRMMDKKQEFLVVLYNDRIYPMLDTKLMNTKPIKATEHNIERVLKWLKFQQPMGSTLPARAMRGSLEVQPSSIFFLSDGELADDTIGLLRRLNIDDSRSGAKKIPIHTITLGSTGIGAGMMRQIANENDGDFVWVK